MTPNDVERERADSTGLASRPDMRLSLWLRAHAGPATRLFAAYNELMRAVMQDYPVLLLLLAIGATAYAFPEAVVRIIGLVR